MYKSKCRDHLKISQPRVSTWRSATLSSPTCWCINREYISEITHSNGLIIVVYTIYIMLHISKTIRLHWILYSKMVTSLRTGRHSVKSDHATWTLEGRSLSLVCSHALSWLSGCVPQYAYPQNWQWLTVLCIIITKTLDIKIRFPLVTVDDSFKSRLACVKSLLASLEVG